jgi:hypothetical protein
MARLDTIQPYVEQLFEDSEVQNQLSRAAANLRSARTRATKAKSKKRAAQDGVLYQRVLDGGKALVAAGEAIARGPQKQRRRTWRRRLVVVAGLGVAAYVATNATSKAKPKGGEATT